MTPLDLANAEIARLQAKVDALETDVRFYKRQAEVERADEAAILLRAHLRLRPQVAWLLAALKGAGPRGLANDWILANMPGGGIVKPSSRDLKLADVAVCDIRRRIGADTILTLWARGYALTAKGEEVVARALIGALEDVPEARAKVGRRERRKLSETAVRVIRHANLELGSSDRTLRALAAAYGCSVGLVYAVRSGELYADVA